MCLAIFIENNKKMEEFLIRSYFLFAIICETENSLPMKRFACPKMKTEYHIIPHAFRSKSFVHLTSVRFTQFI